MRICNNASFSCCRHLPPRQHRHRHHHHLPPRQHYHYLHLALGTWHLAVVFTIMWLRFIPISGVNFSESFPKFYQKDIKLLRMKRASLELFGIFVHFNKTLQQQEGSVMYTVFTLHVAYFVHSINSVYFCTTKVFDQHKKFCTNTKGFAEIQKVLDKYKKFWTNTKSFLTNTKSF